MNHKKHLVMVSLDDVADGDVDYLLGLPNFSRLCREGTLVRDVDSVFISNTYPAHASVITGVYPEKHGIIENCFTQPGNGNPDWRCDVKDIRTKTLFDVAKQANLTVCSILYPVTCNAKIRWNIPEIPGVSGMLRMLWKLLRTGSPGFVVGAYLQGRKLLKGFSQPWVDDFATSAALYALKHHKPDLLLVHLCDADIHKHVYGPQSAQVEQALQRLDNRLGLLLDALSKTRPGEALSIIVFSDHGCLPVHTTVDPNDALKRAGLIRNPAKKASDFDAFFHNAGGTSFLKVYDSDKRDDAVRATSQVLSEPSVKRQLTVAEMKASGMDQEFMLGIEAADGFSFGEEFLGQHGYSLMRQGYKPFYLAVGGKAAPGRILHGGCIIDICPLAAQMLGLPVWEMDGINRMETETDR